MPRRVCRVTARCMRMVKGLLLVTLLVPAGACQKQENTAARARVFSPPPPDPFVAKAAQKLDVSRLDQDDELKMRVFSMLFPEVHARAKAGAFTVEETLTLNRGPGSVRVEEKGSITFNSHGDMAVELATGPTEKQQLIYANEVLYLRNRAGSWRASRDPADERHFWADNTYAALRTTTEMVAPHFTLKTLGKEKVQGRAATRFGFKLKDGPHKVGALNEDKVATTTVPLPDGGAFFEAAQRRRQALEQGQPQSLEGTVLMDDVLGIPLKTDMVLVMALPAPQGVDAANMTIELHTRLTDVGKDEEIKPPGKAVDEIIRQRVAPNPLEFLDGGARKSARAAPRPAAAAPAAEPPDDGEE